MAEMLLDAQSTPAGPASGKLLAYPSAADLQLVSQDQNNKKLCLPGIKNFNTADAVASAANTYLSGSRIVVPQHGLQAGMIFRWVLGMTKTAAGVAAPVWTIVVGPNGTTADTVRCTFTGPAQTAAVDAGQVSVIAVLRNVGAAGVLAGNLCLDHNLAITGFSILQPVLSSVSAGFDTTPANLSVGLCVNPGASGVWTHQIVTGQLLNG